MSRPLVASLALSATLLWAATAQAQYCPCYTASSPNNTHDCAIEAVAGTNPTTAEWQPIFLLVAQGPTAWGNAGPSSSDIGQGCDKPEAYHEVGATFPCELLKGIASQESGWHQFCVPTTPSDQVGGAERTIISFDCGYGVGQVTSGMHVGETPAFDRERVAGDAIYSLATGARILASKWRATQCVGDNQPSVIEHWYTATWAYNGLATSNNPNNPSYDPNRGVWDPDVGGSRPYQEKVWGWMEHTQGKWDGLAPAYPNPGEMGTDGSPPELSEPSCASPTDCVGTRPTHVTACDGTGAGGSGGGGSVGGSGTGGNIGDGGDGGESTGGSATTAPPGGITGDDSDCSCRQPGGSDAPGPWALLLLLAPVVARRASSRRLSQ
ncbi:MAG: hypothetical protein JRI68_10620 [Deltaproteobacteria bacterium]|nr:hypothetical protein [Deltaproteobacteria bacterium]